MKSFVYKISLLLGLVLALTACDDRFDDLNIAELTDFPPGILQISPADGSKVVLGDFNIVARFVDGSTSPLSTGTITLTDAAGTELGSTTQSLSGTADSLVLAGSDFQAASLEVGLYNIQVSVTDAQNQTQMRNTSFELSALPFAAANDAMFLAGTYNGWGADELTLVADNTWEIKGIEMDGGEWKLKNCADWCDKDWGNASSSECEGGLVAETTGGGTNSACSPAGIVNFRFNDQTLTFTIEPAVSFAGNTTDLYLLGTFNDFQGEEYRFTQVGDNSWELKEVLLNPADKFRFAEGPSFMGKNWGDNEGDGVAEEFGTNITFGELPASQGEAFYDLTFNDKSLEYTITFNKFPSIGIIGSATPGGWDTDTDLNDNGDGTFSLIVALTDGEAKFRANDDWATNWGGADFPMGIATQDGPNIPVTAGTYEVIFNPSTGEYEFAAPLESLGIIGSATPGGWDADTDLRDLGDGNFQVVIGLTDGEVKFRANDDWPLNWGAGDFPDGTGTPNGDNIPVTAGIYLVSFNVGTGAYSFAPASVGIIGSATPGGWDSDTDMTVVDAVGAPGEVSLSVELVDGEAKFRVNDDWPWNWGAGDFPMGTGVQDGANIPVTAGTYTVKFNVNTGAYSFE